MPMAEGIESIRELLSLNAPQEIKQAAIDAVNKVVCGLLSGLTCGWHSSTDLYVRFGGRAAEASDVALASVPGAAFRCLPHCLPSRALRLAGNYSGLPGPRTIPGPIWDQPGVHPEPARLRRAGSGWVPTWFQVGSGMVPRWCRKPEKGQEPTKNNI